MKGPRMLFNEPECSSPYLPVLSPDLAAIHSAAFAKHGGRWCGGPANMRHCVQ
jgi:hypothetical protein